MASFHFPLLLILSLLLVSVRAVTFVAYHDRTAAYHQQQFTALYAKKWRMISLSVYGTPSNARYAAVWVATNKTPNWMGRIPFIYLSSHLDHTFISLSLQAFTGP